MLPAVPEDARGGEGACRGAGAAAPTGALCCVGVSCCAKMPGVDRLEPGQWLARAGVTARVRATRGAESSACVTLSSD